MSLPHTPRRSLRKRTVAVVLFACVGSLFGGGRPAAASLSAALTALVCPTEGEGAAPGEVLPTQWRGRQTVLILAAKSEQATVYLYAAGAATGRVRYTALSVDKKRLAQGECAPGKEAAFTLAAGSRCILYLNAETAAVTLRVANGAYGLLAAADAPARLGGQSGRLYFMAPRGTGTFTVHARAERVENPLQVRVFSPAGKEVASSTTGADGMGATVVADTGSDAGGIWSLHLSRAGSGENVEALVWLSREVSPFLADSPRSLAVPFLHYSDAGALYLGGNERSAVLQAGITVTPGPERRVRAALLPVGSSRAIADTRPAPFSNGLVRIVLPQTIPAGAYDLRTALLDPGEHLAGTHLQRLVIADGFVHLNEKKPLLECVASPTDATDVRSFRVRLGVEAASMQSLGLHAALYREDENTPVSQAQYSAPLSGVAEIPVPDAATEGLHRMVVSLTDGAGKSLASATQWAYLSGGRLFLESPPPTPAKKATLRPSQRQRGYVLFSRAHHEALPYNHEPTTEEIGRPLSVWATPGEYESASFGVYTLKPLQQARVKVGLLSRVGQGGKIDPAHVDVRLVRYWPQRDEEDATRFRIVPELLEPTTTANLPGTRISQYWLTLRVPENTPPGDYRGLITFSAANAPASELKFLLKVLPFTLAKPPTRTWGLYADSARWANYSEAEIAQEMRDMKAHGIDALRLSPLAHGVLHDEDGRLGVDFAPLAGLMNLYRQSGLKGPVLLDFDGLGAAIARARGATPPLPDAEASRLYPVVLADLAMRAATQQWPEMLCQVVSDEASWSPETLARARRELSLFKQAGLVALVSLPDPATAAKLPAELQPISCYAAASVLQSPAAAAAARARRQESGTPFAFVSRGREGALLPNRYLAGVAFWRSGASVHWASTYQRPNGDAYSDFDGAKDACLVYPTPGKHPLVPTLQWEGLREGIDDARYLYTFEQMVAKTKASGVPVAVAYARQVEKEAQERLNRIAWGVEPAGVSNQGLQELRVWLSQAMGTMLNKVKAGQAPKPKARSSRRR